MIWDDISDQYMNILDIFVINQCDFSSTTPSDIKIHIYTTHKGAKYECNKCDIKVKKSVQW